jgi:hypothetical protein
MLTTHSVFLFGYLLTRLHSDRALNIRPDLSDQEADENDRWIGPTFLWDFEQEQRKLKEALLDSKEEHDVEMALRASQEPKTGESANVDGNEEIKMDPDTSKKNEHRQVGSKGGNTELKTEASLESEKVGKKLEVSTLTGGALILGVSDAVLFRTTDAAEEQESSKNPKDTQVLEMPALVKDATESKQDSLVPEGHTEKL